MQPLIRATWQLFPSIPGQDVCLISNSVVFCLGFVPHVMLLVNTVSYHSSTGNTIPSMGHWILDKQGSSSLIPDLQLEDTVLPSRTLRYTKLFFTPKYQILAVIRQVENSL